MKYTILLEEGVIEHVFFIVYLPIDMTWSLIDAFDPTALSEVQQYVTPRNFYNNR